MDDNRTARLDAYKAVRAIVEEHRGVKLFENEANDIIWAAEGLLLAGKPAWTHPTQSKRAPPSTRWSTTSARTAGPTSARRRSVCVGRSRTARPSPSRSPKRRHRTRPALAYGSMFGAPMFADHYRLSYLNTGCRPRTGSLHLVRGAQSSAPSAPSPSPASWVRGAAAPTCFTNAASTR